MIGNLGIFEKGFVTLFSKRVVLNYTFSSNVGGPFSCYPCQNRV